MNTPQAKCPICAKHAPRAPFTPFCSRRCAEIDLGHWLTGHYVAPGEPLSPDDEDSSGAT